MPSYKVIFPAVAGAILMSCVFGLLVFGLDYFVVWIGEMFAELVGLLPTGWAQGHVSWTVTAASIITAPLVVVIFVTACKQILRVETALAHEDAVRKSI